MAQPQSWGQATRAVLWPLELSQVRIGWLLGLFDSTKGSLWSCFRWIMVGHKSRWVFFDLIQLKFTEAKIAAPWGGGDGVRTECSVANAAAGDGGHFFPDWFGPSSPAGCLSCCASPPAGRPLLAPSCQVSKVRFQQPLAPGAGLCVSPPPPACRPG